MAEAPGKLFGVLARRPDGDTTISLEIVRNEGLRFADRIVSRIDTASHIFAGRLDTPEADKRGLTWRLNTADRAYQTAAQSRPIAAISDLLALCIYERAVHRLYWSTRYGEEADEPMLTVWSSLVEEGLETTNRLLSEELSASISRVIVRWDETATDPDELQRAGPPRFEDLVQKDLDPEESVSLFGALGLDPLDGIEPAAREVARARELGERAVYLAQRAPRTLAWRAELLTLQLTEQTDVHSVVDSVERTSKAVETTSATVAALPEKLRVESQALLQDISKELSVQRAGLVEDLDRTSTSTQAALDSATRLAEALDVTTKSVTEFMVTIQSDDEPLTPEQAAAEAAEPPGKPYDPDDYTELATVATQLAIELNTTVRTAEVAVPIFQKSVDDAATRIDRSVDRVFSAATRFALIAIGAVFLGILLLRYLPQRRRRDPAG